MWGLPHHRLMYVGDNPAKDFATPRRLGWQTVRLRMQGQLRFAEEPPSPAYGAAAEVTSIDAIRGVLGLPPIRRSVDADFVHSA
jgi:putative hydrolase of the HAD superfamily